MTLLSNFEKVDRTGPVVAQMMGVTVNVPDKGMMDVM
jgi:hypothetical protein